MCTLLMAGLLQFYGVSVAFIYFCNNARIVPYTIDISDVATTTDGHRQEKDTTDSTRPMERNRAYAA